MADPSSIVYEQHRYSLQFAGVNFLAEIWDGKTSPAQDTYIAVDTETLPIIRGTVPTVATLQVYYPSSQFVQLVQGTEKVNRYFQHLLEVNPTAMLVFHNFPFDYEVLGGRNNKALYSALMRDRIVDTRLRWLLRQNEDGNWLNEDMPSSLEYVCEQLLGITIEKDKELRTSFRPDVKLTEKQIKYACIDPVATMITCQAMPKQYPTEQLQIRAAVVLNDMLLRGLFVDRHMFNQLREKYTQLEEDCLTTMNVFGYFPGNKELSVKIRQKELLENIEQRCGIRFPRTDKTKEISASSKVIASFEDRVHPFITACKTAANANKFLKSYLSEEFLGSDGRVHGDCDVIKRTGRTSLKNPPLQQMPRGGGIREQYRAAPGKCLLAVDYAQQELVSLAQSCIYYFGYSKMAEMINEGKDLHKELGKKIMEDAGGNPADGVDYRQLAKSVNFGAPGGLGKKTFVDYAKTNYGVNVTEEQAENLIHIWKETFPEMEQHLKPVPDPRHPGMYIVEVKGGRIRSNTPFCAACNTKFQGLASDCSKLALWFCYKESVPVVNFVHDEIISEWFIDDQLQNNVTKVQALMLEAMGVLCPDVKAKVEAALMINWNKNAKPIFDSCGHRLLIWTPDIITVSAKDKEQKWRKLINKSIEELATFTPQTLPSINGFRAVWNEGAKSIYGWQPLVSAYN